MTELQVKAAQLAEDKRHNIMSEQLTRKLNEAQAEHLKTSDQYTAEHYVRSDQAGLISANANAMNAGTNRANFNMQYDIEYGWTGSEGYPSGMPLSAQIKNAEIEKTIRLTNVQEEQYKADALNKRVTAVTNILNSVFGKGGIVNTVNDVIGPRGDTYMVNHDTGTSLVVTE